MGNKKPKDLPEEPVVEASETEDEVEPEVEPIPGIKEETAAVVAPPKVEPVVSVPLSTKRPGDIFLLGGKKFRLVSLTATIADLDTGQLGSVDPGTLVT